MEQIKIVLKSVFEGFNDDMFDEDLKLGDLPNWDSMNSVNLQIELESTFAVDLSEGIFQEEHRISDLLDILRKAGIQI